MNANHEKPGMSDALATPRELAAKYGVALSTFLGWHHAGIFPAEVAVGKVYRFDPDQVETGLKRHARKAGKKSRQPLA